MLNKKHRTQIKDKFYQAYNEIYPPFTKNQLDRIIQDKIIELTLYLEFTYKVYRLPLVEDFILNNNYKQNLYNQ